MGWKCACADKTALTIYLEEISCTHHTLVLASVHGAAAADEPLPSWTDGIAKRAIVDFVQRVTTPGGKDFVPESERIATFDNDGTL